MVVEEREQSWKLEQLSPNEEELLALCGSEDNLATVGCESGLRAISAAVFSVGWPRDQSEWISGSVSDGP